MTLSDELHPVIRPGWALPTDPREFRSWLRFRFAPPGMALSARVEDKLVAFMKLPVAQEMPGDLREALGLTRPG